MKLYVVSNSLYVCVENKFFASILRFIFPLVGKRRAGFGDGYDTFCDIVTLPVQEGYISFVNFELKY